MREPQSPSDHTCPTMPLVPIDRARHEVEIDLRYATERNFTGRPVYARALPLLHQDALAALEHAIAQAKTLGLRLKLLDLYRPPEAQWKLWAHTPDPEFLAVPWRGSPHGRGVAVDLTLMDSEGRELDMGTEFDAFTPRSHHGDAGVSPEAQRNRLLLLGLMTTAGFDFYRSEWWHYQLFDARARYPLIADGAAAPRMM
ncbi:MAG TPA: D-alanyl-D-alanine dipeptidase [Geminicoccus sp.]|nr:D-alanyl-D-alanine dipeptidase [Geminicoccus sp.]HWL70730.1 D-alanyl-D-alanine dipeptidase [Geminicoccus sp.]